MQPDPLTVSLETLIAAAPMLGYPLEDRSRVRDAQDPGLVAAFQAAGELRLGHPAQRALFLVAPLDVLVVDAGGQKRFHIIEVNGTGIGGLTNMPVGVIGAVLGGLTGAAAALAEPDPLVLVASSGLESSRTPRRNHLVHEKVLYVEAVRRAFRDRDGAARVLTLTRLADDPGAVHTGRPTVVLGYIKEFLNHLSVGPGRRLALFGRPVAAMVNDRFCLNAVARFAGQFDLGRVATLNRSFAAGADKGVAYDLLNEYARAHPSRYFPEHVPFDRAGNRAELIAAVLDWLARGRKVVIKPQGTGLGHGLEFFLDPDEPVDGVVAKVDHSVRVTEHYYGAVGGAFPYTVCEFVDTAVVRRGGHEFHGHKYEVRVVVYRDGGVLRALPSIAKVSSQGYDADRPTRLSLINNITTSAEAKKREGTDFMLPLSNRETLGLLGLRPEELEAACGYCAGYIRHVLDRVLDQPDRFGLPREEPGGGVVNGQRVGG